MTEWKYDRPVKTARGQKSLFRHHHASLGYSQIVSRDAGASPIAPVRCRIALPNMTGKPPAKDNADVPYRIVAEQKFRADGSDPGPLRVAQHVLEPVAGDRSNG